MAAKRHSAEDGSASKSQQKHLLKHMDITMQQKLAVASAHIQLHDGARILDAGCAGGRSSYMLALMNPHLDVVGIDFEKNYIEDAKQNFQLPNLSFVQGDIRDLGEEHGTFDAILDSSLMHEVYSYSGYDNQAVMDSTEAMLGCLNNGGVIIRRDFVKPDSPDEMVYLDLPPQHQALFTRYAQEANSLNPEASQGFYVEQTEVLDEGWKRYRLAHSKAYEFIWRKEYTARFVPESREQYGVWTAKEYLENTEKLGGRLEFAGPYNNPWIAKNWYEGQFRLYDLDMKPLQAPPSNYFAIVRKTDPGESQRVFEHKVSKDKPSYLKIRHFEHSKTGHLLDLICRPGAVYDVLPYDVKDDGRLVVYAKNGFPRPVSNVMARQTPNIDGKVWSGHMVETMSIANQFGTMEEAAEQVLFERAGFKPEDVSGIVKANDYYVAPLDMNEHVTAVFARVQNTPYEASLKKRFYNFAAMGTLREYDAQSLLRGVQVGMVPEMRLEMNLYSLLRKAGMSPDAWIGETFDLAEGEIDNMRSFKSLSRRRNKGAFKETDKSAGYLDSIRSVFLEVSSVGGIAHPLASQELEFVYPSAKEDKTANSVMVLPVIKDKNTNEILLGVKVDDFPSVQLREGKSRMMTVPRFTLPRSVQNLDDLKNYTAARNGVDKGAVTLLGESYFPSMGVMPNRIYPAVIQGTAEAFKDSKYSFVPLRELFCQLDKIKDANLMLAVYRAVHAFGVWDKYAKDLKPQIDTELTLKR